MSNESIKSRKYYRVHNGESWDRMHFVTDANSVDANDGDTMETKVGAIKGITTSTEVTEEGYAADATVVAALNSSLGGLDIRFNSETGKPEWKERGADSFNPFSCGNFTITVGIVARARYTGNNFVAGSITITRTIRYENGELVYSTDATNKKNFTPSSTSLFIDAYISSVTIEFD